MCIQVTKATIHEVTKHERNQTYDPSGRPHIELLVRQNRTVTIKAGHVQEDPGRDRLTDDYAYDLPALET